MFCCPLLLETCVFSPIKNIAFIWIWILLGIITFINVLFIYHLLGSPGVIIINFKLRIVNEQKTII